jgi:hypothetical protein
MRDLDPLEKFKLLFLLFFAVVIVFMSTFHIAARRAEAWTAGSDDPLTSCSDFGDTYSGIGGNPLQDLADGIIPLGSAPASAQTDAQDYLSGGYEPGVDHYAFAWAKATSGEPFKLWYSATLPSGWTSVGALSDEFGENALYIGDNVWSWSPTDYGTNYDYPNSPGYANNGIYEDALGCLQIAGDYYLRGTYDGFPIENYTFGGTPVTQDPPGQCGSSKPFYTNKDGLADYGDASIINVIGEVANGDFTLAGGVYDVLMHEIDTGTIDQSVYKSYALFEFRQNREDPWTYGTDAPVLVMVTPSTIVGENLLEWHQNPDGSFKFTTLKSSVRWESKSDSNGDYGDGYDESGNEWYDIEYYYYDSGNREFSMSPGWSIDNIRCVNFIFASDDASTYDVEWQHGDYFGDYTNFVETYDPEVEEPCSTFDIACHIGKIFDGVADTFLGVGEAIVGGIASLFIPNVDEVKSIFTNLFDAVSDKLGFLLFPFEFFIDAFTGMANAASCAPNCSINFGNMFGGDLVVDPLEIQASIPSYYAIGVNIIRGTTVLTLIGAFYHKFKEVSAS